MKVCERFRDHQATEFCERKSNIVIKGKGKEAGKELRVVNSKKDEFCKVQVDGQYIFQESACDFLLANCSTDSLIFIELKGGSDVKKACRQIQKTVNFFRKEKVVNTQTTIRAIIITNQTPRPRFYATPLLHLRNLLNAYSGDVIIQTRQYTLQN